MKQQGAAFWLALLGLGLMNGWLAWSGWAQWDQAQQSLSQTRHLEALASKIETLRDAPAQLEEGARSGEALSRLVENAARDVNLNPEQIVRIDPGEPRRIEKTSFLEQRTNIELREAPLQKIVELVLSLEQSGKGMEIPTLSLRVPAGNEVNVSHEELWNAQLVLTCHIFEVSIPSSPKTVHSQ